jgi:hypothetical protein
MTSTASARRWLQSAAASCGVGGMMDADRLLGKIDEILTWSDEHFGHARKRRRAPVSRGGLSDEELLEQADGLLQRRRYGEPRSGGYFQKATGSGDEGPNAHAETKASHHLKMQRLYEAIADRHAAMADHYGSGAKGAHLADGEDDDQPVRSPIQQGDADADALKVLTSAGLDVEARLARAALDREAVRKCLARPQTTDPSSAAFHLVLRRST